MKGKVIVNNFVSKCLCSLLVYYLHFDLRVSRTDVLFQSTATRPGALPIIGFDGSNTINIYGSLCAYSLSCNSVCAGRCGELKGLLATFSNPLDIVHS